MWFIGLGWCPNCGNDELRRSRIQHLGYACAPFLASAREVPPMYAPPLHSDMVEDEAPRRACDESGHGLASSTLIGQDRHTEREATLTFRPRAS
jgi:hypothetical protein